MVEEIQSPIEILGVEYKDDLSKLKTMNPVAITKFDINKLYDIANKYGIENKITKHNFYKVKGMIVRTILEKLEKFAIKDVLGKAIEESPNKLPAERIISKQKIPKSIREDVDKSG